MNLKTGTEAAQFPEKEYINGIFVAVHAYVKSLDFGQGEHEVLSLYSKQRNAGKSQLNESTLFCLIHKHRFGGLGGRYTNFMRVDPFSGGVGGVLAFSKAEFSL
jgi:hypothetical protein